MGAPLFLTNTTRNFAGAVLLALRNNVNVIGTFIEGLTRVKGDWLRSLDLPDDGAFQHIDEWMRVVAMNGVLSARRMLHDQHRALLTGDVG
jgi:hypothetical protein